MLKRKCIHRKVYKTRAKAKCDIYNYNELFYNSTTRHSNYTDLSPMEFEKDYFLKQQSA
ncbi:MAG: IS3 family transposase [Gammaproteobacteria bacterium]|nr:IS3 family transposase [Gammaproteobacteria bacterium]